MSTSNSNDLNAAQNILNDLTKANVKYVKKDKSLFEREAEKVILAEDNRQILLG